MKALKKFWKWITGNGPNSIKSLQKKVMKDSKEQTLEESAESVRRRHGPPVDIIVLDDIGDVEFDREGLKKWQENIPFIDHMNKVEGNLTYALDMRGEKLVGVSIIDVVESVRAHKEVELTVEGEVEFDEAKYIVACDMASGKDEDVEVVVGKIEGEKLTIISSKKRNKGTIL